MQPPDSQENCIVESNWFNIDGERRAVWEGLCPVNEYPVVSPNDLPGPLPRALTLKFDSVLVAASGSPDGVVYWMLNGNRVEWQSKRQPSGAIDQQPFGIAFIGDAPVGSGCLVQHGNWTARTTPPPPGFWPQVQAAGVGNICWLLIGGCPSSLPPASRSDRPRPTSRRWTGRRSPGTGSFPASRSHVCPSGESPACSLQSWPPTMA